MGKRIGIIYKEKLPLFEIFYNITGGEKSKEGTRKRKQLSGEAGDARKIRELERSWFGRRTKPPVNYLKEPYEEFNTV